MDIAKRGKKEAEGEKKDSQECEHKKEFIFYRKEDETGIEEGD